MKYQMIRTALFFNIFLCIATSFASVPKQEIISVDKALSMAVATLRGKALEDAKKHINDRSIGGMTISLDTANKIINDALVAPQAPSCPPATAHKSQQDKDLEEQLALIHSLNQSDQPQPYVGSAGAKTAADTSKKDVKSSKEGAHEMDSILAQLGLGKQKKVGQDPLSPEALKAKVTYVQTTPQGSNECGFRAVFFAKIVSQLPIDQINTKTINEKMKSFKKKICQRFISDEEVIALANKEAIENLHVVAYGNNQILPLYHTHKSSADIDETIAKLLGKKIERAYFVVNQRNIGGIHWVLISVINQKVGKPRIFYFDSLNQEIKPGYGAYALLQQLIQALEL